MATIINSRSVVSLPKQIRFVNSQGQPPSKRRRINAACLTCRKRKTRCAGEKPTCSTCTKNGHVCLGYNKAEEERREPGDSPKPESDDASPPDQTPEHGYEQRDGAPGGSEPASWCASTTGQQHDHARGGRPAAPRRSSGSSTGTSTRTARARTHSSEWDPDQAQARQHQGGGRKPPYARTVSFSEDSRSSNNRSPLQHLSESHKMPYFRYFGPTAIVPGYKQMVVNVSVRDRRRSMGQGSFSAPSPASAVGRGHILGPPAHSEAVFDNVDDVPVYDPSDGEAVHPLVTSLVETFFSHLGSNYPFLRKARFLRMLGEKRVEPILVDAMCSLAARFSDMAVLATGGDPAVTRAECGQTFAQRAKAATVDTFPCPSVGAVQAFLLIAYESFGANEDSALWMYLGLAIRMALDLGLQKMVGIKYQGEKDPWYTRTRSRRNSESGTAEPEPESTDGDPLSPEEQQELEQERTDTFWAVFVLDRVISSGTGRPVTFGDGDFELALPEPALDPATGWPAPFPTFLEVIHLYGRASDVLNNIRNSRDLTRDKMAKLAEMESDLTKLYQKQDPRLHFNAYNFQEYVRAGQGTTFILLHFWFHALIIILHQPALLTPFGSLSRSHQLSPTSRELSMSSAKTIADILAFAELIDPKSFVGNPFTSQPIYIAACAFLMESVAKSQSASQEAAPPSGAAGACRASGPQPDCAGDARVVSKHSLLASAANQNYQRCYKSLQQLLSYWGGVKYILTALDQKSKGIWDCETYTNEEYESTRVSRRASLSRFPLLDNPASPSVPPIAWSLTGTTNSPNTSLTLLYQNIGANGAGQAAAPTQPPPAQEPPASAPTPPGNMIYDPIRQSLPGSPVMFPPPHPQPNVSAVRYSAQAPKAHRLAGPPRASCQTAGRSPLRYGSRPSSEDMGIRSPAGERRLPVLANMAQGGARPPPAPLPHQPYTAPHAPHPSSSYEHTILQGGGGAFSDPRQQQQQQQQQQQGGHNGSGHGPAAIGGGYAAAAHGFTQGDLAAAAAAAASDPYSFLGPGAPITDVITFNSHEIDLASFGLPMELMPSWLEYIPGDVLSMFEGGGMNGGQQG